ncbi:RebB family R body protein [Sagittula sp. S175]|uniref:RebB family R body protein n=1 Tax=Sagittula sp. S175 TaxID=3415129 RepID=UPI003C79FF48
MAFPTAVNDQITDSITQANVSVLGTAPAMAVGNLYVATAQAMSNAAHNATNQQQQANITAQAATVMGVATLYKIDTASTGVATASVLKGGN